MRHATAIVALVLLLMNVGTARAQSVEFAPGVQIESQEFDAGSGVFRFTLRNATESDVVAWVYRLTLRHVNGQVTHQDQLNDEVIGRALAKATPSTPKSLPTRPDFVGVGLRREFSLRAQPPNGFPDPPGPVVSIDVQFLALVFDDGTGVGEPAQVDRIAAVRSQQAKDGLAALGVLRSQVGANPEELSTRLRRASRQLSPAASQLVDHVAKSLANYDNADARANALKTMTQLYDLRYRALSQPIVRK
jgi:hypothetical protein